MSDDYREIAQGDIGSDEGNSSNHIAELETDDFVWEDYWEEIGRFENLSVDICKERVVLIFSLSPVISWRDASQTKFPTI